MLALPLSGSTPELYHGKYVAGMYGSGEQGCWYEPSLSNGTLFQDAAGTTPVTAVEQAVGLMLDKRKGVGSNGAKRVNLLNYSEQFDRWSTVKTGTATFTITPNFGIAPDGTQTACRAVLSGTGGFSEIFTSAYGGTIVGQSYTVSVWLKSLSGIVNTTITGPSPYGPLVTVTSEWQKFTQIVVVTGTTSQRCEILAGALGASANIDILIWHPDLRLASEANTLPTYQRIDADWSSTIPGNHAKQTTSADRPVFSARYNLLTKTEQFDQENWNWFSLTCTPNFATSPLGGITADLVIETPSNGQHIGYYGPKFSVIAGMSYRFSIYLKKHTTSRGVFSAGFGGSLFSWVEGCTVNLNTETVSMPAHGSNAKLTNVGDGWYRFEYSALAPSTGTAEVIIGTRLTSVGSSVYTGDGVSGVYIWGASLVPANQAHLPYQRVNTATDYDADPVKFPPYLKFNGTNSWMVTNSIDFTGTYKMTVFAGVRKLSDSTVGMILELGNGISAPYFHITANGGGANDNDYNLTLASGSYTGALCKPYIAPLTNIISASYDLQAATKATQVKPKINGTVPASLTYSGGTITLSVFTNNPIYIGRRAGTSLPFNGNLHSLIIRGAATDDAHLTNAEKLVAFKTGINL